MKQEQIKRRAFLKKAGQTAVTAPAVAVLMAAGSKQASAQFFGVINPVSGTINPDVAQDDTT